VESVQLHVIKFSPYFICSTSNDVFSVCILLLAKYPEKADTVKYFTTGRKKENETREIFFFKLRLPFRNKLNINMLELHILLFTASHLSLS